MPRLFAVLLLALSLPGLAVPAVARVRVAAHERVARFSVQGLQSSMDGDEIVRNLLEYKGVRAARFEHLHAEVVTRLAAGVSDAQICEMIQKMASGLRALPGAGQGRYVPFPDYPPGADVVAITRDGSRVGPLARYAVRGHTTVFDISAVWCAPCRVLDQRLRALTQQRPGIAIRKLDVVSFDSPLAHELGPKLTGLPYVVVIGADGVRRDFDGADYAAVAKVYGWPK